MITYLEFEPLKSERKFGFKFLWILAGIKQWNNQVKTSVKTVTHEISNLRIFH